MINTMGPGAMTSFITEMSPNSKFAKKGKDCAHPLIFQTS